MHTHIILTSAEKRSLELFCGDLVSCGAAEPHGIGQIVKKAGPRIGSLQLAAEVWRNIAAAASAISSKCMMTI
jgi:hypothetical protein